MTLRVTSVVIAAAAAACSHKLSAEPPRAPGAMSPRPLVRADRAAFCAPHTDESGCTVTCTDPPEPWTSSTRRFARLELWARKETCPDSAIPPVVNCTFAVSTGSGWFVTEEVPCRRTGVRNLTGISVTATPRPQADVIEYTLHGEILSMDPASDGVNHVDTEHDVSQQFSLVCGMGGDGIPRCTPPFATAVHDLAYGLVRRPWRIDDGGTLVIEPIEVEATQEALNEGVVGKFALDLR